MICIRVIKYKDMILPLLPISFQFYFDECLSFLSSNAIKRKDGTFLTQCLTFRESKFWAFDFRKS